MAEPASHVYSRVPPCALELYETLAPREGGYAELHRIARLLICPEHAPNERWQRRAVALWRELAKRYPKEKDEGYGAALLWTSIRAQSAALQYANKYAARELDRLTVLEQAAATLEDALAGEDVAVPIRDAEPALQTHVSARTVARWLQQTARRQHARTRRQVAAIRSNRSQNPANHGQYQRAVVRALQAEYFHPRGLAGMYASIAVVVEAVAGAPVGRDTVKAIIKQGSVVPSLPYGYPGSSMTR